MIKHAKKRPVGEGDTIGKKSVVQSGESNKPSKKLKVENGTAVQNGQAGTGNKAQMVKKLNKDKKGQNKQVVQNAPKKEHKGASKETSEKQKTQNQTAEEKEKNLKLLKKRQDSREKRKLQRQQKGQYPSVAELSVEQLKERIKEIESRESLSRSAKRKLAALRKKIRIAEGTDTPAQQPTKKQAKKDKSLEATKKKQVQGNEVQKKNLKSEKSEAKQNQVQKKKDTKQGSLLLVKQSHKDEDDEDDDDEEEEDDEMEVDSEGDDESNVEEGDEEDDDDDEDDDEEEVEDEEEQDDEDDDDDDDETKVDDVKVSPKEKPKQNKQKGNQSVEDATKQEGKKKRYVLFVGNVPYNVTTEELKKHFLTKVSEVVDVRIPPKKGTNQPRGFAYVELANSTDYEKALSLHNSFMNGRKLNVQYSASGSKNVSNKKEVVAKNLKLNALRKAGKLAGSKNKHNQKHPGKKGKYSKPVAT